MSLDRPAETPEPSPEPDPELVREVRRMELRSALAGLVIAVEGRGDLGQARAAGRRALGWPAPDEHTTPIL